MSDLIVIGRDSHEKATANDTEVLAIQRDFVIDLRGHRSGSSTASVIGRAGPLPARPRGNHAHPAGTRGIVTRRCQPPGINVG